MLRHRRHPRQISPRRDDRRIEQRDVRHPHIIQRRRRCEVPTKRRPNQPDLLITANGIRHTPKRIPHDKILRRTIAVCKRDSLQGFLEKKRFLPARGRVVAMKEVEQNNPFLGSKGDSVRPGNEPQSPTRYVFGKLYPGFHALSPHKRDNASCFINLIPQPRK